VSKAKVVLTAISGAAVCGGNSDEKFLALPNIHENTMKDASRKFIIWHVTKHEYIYWHTCKLYL